jgi:acyl carrier protein
MNNNDRLYGLLLEFFDLRAETPAEEITQSAIGAWDSLAMVQLIAELQGTFRVEFELDEIERLRSYDEISHALARKGVPLNEPMT